MVAPSDAAWRRQAVDSPPSPRLGRWAPGDPKCRAGDRKHFSKNDFQVDGREQLRLSGGTGYLAIVPAGKRTDGPVPYRLGQAFQFDGAVGGMSIEGSTGLIRSSPGACWIRACSCGSGAPIGAA